MNDKRIDQLTEKTNLLNSDLIVVAESSGTTWKSTIQKFRESLFGLVDLITGTPDKNDSVFFRTFTTGAIRRVPIQKLLPDGVVTNNMLADGSDTQGTGISESKLAPGSVTHPKLAIDAVHTHNIHNAEQATIDNYPSRSFGTGITTEKICDNAVTGMKGGVPPGAVFHFAAQTTPQGYLWCNGDVISDDYGGITQGVNNWRLQDLRMILGTTYGQLGQLPDLRGSFIRGFSATGGSGHPNLGKGSVYKHFIRQGSGPTNGASLQTEAINFAGDLGTVSYFVVEYTNNSLTLNNPSDGPRNPRSGAYIQVVTFGKTTAEAPTVILDSNARWRIYAMRYIVSGAFGKHQESRYMSHTHAISEANHEHKNLKTVLNQNAWIHTHPSETIQFGKSNSGKGSIFGSSSPNNCGSGGCNKTVTIRPQIWTNQSTTPISTAATTTEDDANTQATCEASFSYGYSALRPAAAPVFSRPTLASTVTFDPVDETRPVNMALLPCIKY